MKNLNMDILADRPELKEMPYGVPEGYFGGFKSRAGTFRKENHRTKVLPYVSIAASVALLVAAGLLIFRISPIEDEFTYEDFLVFSGTEIDVDYYDRDGQYADAEIDGEDIIDYLIYSGITAEELEYYK